MTYVKQTWIDYNVDYPPSAARFLVMEQGIYDAHYTPVARVYKNSDTVVATNTTTAISFNTVREDALGMWVGTAPTRLTVQRAGLYVVTGQLVWATGTGLSSVILRKNVGGTNIELAAGGGVFSSGFTYVSAAKIERFAVGDYVELIAYHEQGTNRTAQGLYAGYERSSELQMALISY